MITLIRRCFPLFLFLCTLMAIAALIPELMVPSDHPDSVLLKFLYSLPEMLLFPLFSGVFALALADATSDRLTIKDFFKYLPKVREKYWAILLFVIHYSLIYLVGFLFLFVPAIIFYRRYCFGLFLVIFHGMKPSQAFLKSRQMTMKLSRKILPAAFLDFALVILLLASPSLNLSWESLFCFLLLQKIFLFLIFSYLFSLFQVYGEAKTMLLGRSNDLKKMTP